MIICLPRSRDCTSRNKIVELYLPCQRLPWDDTNAVDLRKYHIYIWLHNFIEHIICGSIVTLKDSKTDHEAWYKIQMQKTQSK